LAGENRMTLPLPPLDLVARGPLTFEKIDEERFPCFVLAREALLKGGAYPTILNAANETAVYAFLNRRIAFGRIAKLVEAACSRIGPRYHRPPDSIEEALAVDRHSRTVTEELIASTSA
jgi:1-deoxy-D-xylulose-5-phosphate reductoisomerase